MESVGVVLMMKNGLYLAVKIPSSLTDVDFMKKVRLASEQGATMTFEIPLDKFTVSEEQIMANRICVIASEIVGIYSYFK